jgi:uncharacterized protein (TIGR02246 family)
MKRVIGMVAVLCLVGLTSALGQQADAEMQKLTDQYVAAFNKGDVKALGALHTADTIRVTQTGELIVGRAAVEQDFTAGLAGPLKGAKLAVTPGKVQSLSADVRVTEGTYEVTGSGGSQKGRYLNTLVRQGGQWRLASMATISTTPPPTK